MSASKNIDKPKDRSNAKKSDSAKLPDAFSLFGPSIKALRLNPVTLGVLFLVPALMSYSDRLPWQDVVGADNTTTFTILLLGLMFLAIGLVVVIASFIAELASAKHQKISLAQALKQAFRGFWRLLGLLINMVLIIVVGLLLFIVPGIFAIQRLLLAPYFMIDQDLSIKASIKASFAAGKKHSGALWGVLGILLATTIVGVIPVVGYFASLALGLAYLCAPAIRYVQIKNITT